jgi:uncharacterized protein YjiS (DUF1127 family)
MPGDRHAAPEQSSGQTNVWQSLIGVVTCLKVWRDRSQARADLMRMSERQLRDIGISRYDALHEWKKPFWRR